MGPVPDVSGFLPSQSAFAFTNSWPSEPAISVNTPFGDVNIGDASNGLCGGMVFAVRDYFAAGRTPPEERPAEGTPLFRFIVNRLVTSWDIPRGVAKYYQWMTLPNADTRLEIFGLEVVGVRGVSWRTVVEELPSIRADLDGGQLCCLGVVTTRSTKPADLGLNHQVLTYGYEVDGSTVTLKIYDPNRGRDDDVRITIETGNPSNGAAVRHNIGITRRIRGIFRVTYVPVTPPVG